MHDAPPLTPSMSPRCCIARAFFRVRRGVLLLLRASTGLDLGAAQEAVRIYSPTNGTVYLQPTNVPLSIRINVAVTNDFNARTDIFDGTNLLGSTSLQQHDVLTWSNVAFGEHVLTAIHHASTGAVTSSVVRVSVEFGGWAMVPPGAVWHYLDSGVDPGPGWNQSNVDVSAWPQGSAKLGFGDDDVVTWVNFLNPTNGEYYPTYYFRHPFTVVDPTAISNLAVRLRRDDGAIVYLNGEELFRDNMPAGAVNYRSYTSGQVPDETEFIQRWVNPARLRTGTNYLAVEIHNSGPVSADIGFDLALVADIPVGLPTLAIQRSATNALVSWTVGYVGYRLESAIALSSDGSGWERITNLPAAVQGRLIHANRADGLTRFFRLRLE